MAKDSYCKEAGGVKEKKVGRFHNIAKCAKECAALEVSLFAYRYKDCDSDGCGCYCQMQTVNDGPCRCDEAEDYKLYQLNSSKGNYNCGRYIA